MFVCLCHAVTDREINQAIDDGLQTVSELMSELKVATQCGGCLNEVMQMVGEQQSSLPLGDAKHYARVEVYQPQ